MSDRKQSEEVTLLGVDFDTAMFMDRTELRNCPFCGSQPLTYGKKNEETNLIAYTVKCPNIMCNADITACTGKDAEACRTEVVTRWNKRVK